MPVILLRKDDCKTEKEGHQIDVFLYILNQMGICPTEEEYNRIDFIEIKGKIISIQEENGKEVIKV